MSATDRRRLRQLRRLQTLRTVARDLAAAEAAAAERTLAQVLALDARTRQLAGECSRRIDARDGADIGQVSRFVAGLGAIGRASQADFARSQAIADAKARLLAEREQGRLAAEGQADALARDMARRGAESCAPARKRLGTGLE